MNAGSSLQLDTTGPSIHCRTHSDIPKLRSPATPGLSAFQLTFGSLSGSPSASPYLAERAFPSPTHSLSVASTLASHPLGNRYNLRHSRSTLSPLLLQYLLPPSPDGIPAHLLSRPLKARHKYLSIDPASDPKGYFCLSSTSSEDVVRALEELSTRPEMRVGPGELVQQVGYKAEPSGGGELSAYVRLGIDGLQGVVVVLVWEQRSTELDGTETEAGWRYADLRPLPMPDALWNTPELAVRQTRRVNVPEVGPRSPILVGLRDAGTQEGDGSEEDDYWAQYGASSGEEEGEDGNIEADPFYGPAGTKTNSLPAKKSKGKSKATSSGARTAVTPGGDDAYWGRYGDESVSDSPGLDGSGASMQQATMYFQPAKDVKLQSPLQPGAPKPGLLSLDLLSPSVTNLVPSSALHSATPGSHLQYHAEELAHALSNLSLNLQTSTSASGSATNLPQGLALNLNTPPPTEPSLTTVLPAATPHQNSMSPVIGLGMSMSPLRSATSNHASLLEVLLRDHADCSGSGRHSDSGSTVPDVSGNGKKRVSDEDEAVADSVRGMFRLWKLGKDASLRDLEASGWVGEDPTYHKQQFMALVARALSEL